MTAKEDQSRRGVRTGKGGEGVISMATVPPAPRRPDFQRGRKNFKSQPSALQRLLLKGVHTAPRRAREGRGGRRPRCPEPPAGPPRPRLRERRRAGGRLGCSPLELGGGGRPGPRRREGGVCAPGGGADQPAFLPPAPLRPDADRGAASSLQTGRTPGGERRRGVWGTARASGSPGGWASGSELTVPGEPNSSEGEGARTAPGPEPPDKRRVRAAAPPPLPARSPLN